ncbi:hypothetical protein [Pseudopontixanthobacter vadosimaris]|uniref:hypothetical protein n=1 Tax=Pseudopontixanthobacter vadosimaris TaxID=2726450 RepID=UPI001474FB07|nr:hypothetical protein [Pseudopontixanthobacter vadosimaris]
MSTPEYYRDEISSYWLKHFHCQPTMLERHQFARALPYLGSDDPMMFLTALLIHIACRTHQDLNARFMNDGALAHDLAKEMRSDFAALSDALGRLDFCLDQTQILSEHAEKLISDWGRHEDRLSDWQISAQDLPRWSLFLVIGIVALIIGTAIAIFAT